MYISDGIIKWCQFIVLIIVFREKINLSIQFECPYKNVNEADTLDIEGFNTTRAKNPLAEFCLKENKSHEVKNWKSLNHYQERDLSDMEIESFVKRSLDSNNIKMETINDDNKCNNSYMGEISLPQLECAVAPASCLNDSSSYYFRTYDGSCNNLVKPGYGMAKSRYTRILRPKYGDGYYSPSKSLTSGELPSPRFLSLLLYGEDTLLENDRTLMSMQFGQFVSHDISELYQEGLPNDCCLNSGHKMCYPIALHPLGPIAMTSGKKCLHFVRSLSDMDISCPPSGLPYSEKITTTTAFLDLSSVYGNSLEENKKIRQYKRGLLRTTWFNNNQFLPLQYMKCPANNKQCYSIPDNRNQFTPTVAVMHTLFVREHNRLANILASINPHYSDEKIFQVVRKINIAQYQKIIYYDWLPLILSFNYSLHNHLIYSVSAYDYVNDYNISVNPAPYAEYAAAAFRYLHQAVPGWFSMISFDRNSNKTVRLSDYFDRQDSMKLLMDGNNYDSLIRGLTTQFEKRADSNIDIEIKHHFGRKYFEDFGADLKSIDIQRGRDFGIPSYNDFRVECNITRAHEWSDLLDHIPLEKIQVLKSVYDSPDDIELSVGGSYEKHVPDSMLGPTFQCLISKQFLKTRTGDSFFYENKDTSRGFTRDQLAEIRQITLASILCANANDLQCVQPNVFTFPHPQNNLKKCSAFNQLNLKLWKDHFAN